jgi:hypothetical protein
MFTVHYDIWGNSSIELRRLFAGKNDETLSCDSRRKKVPPSQRIAPK